MIGGVEVGERERVCVCVCVKNNTVSRDRAGREEREEKGYEERGGDKMCEQRGQGVAG